MLMSRLLGRKIAIALGIAALAAGPVFAADRVPSDTYFDQQWYLRQMGVPEAWNSTLGFESVIVAVIDTGVDIDHPDLKDNIWRNQNEIAGNGVDDDRNGYVDDVNGWDFVDSDADPRPVAEPGAPAELMHHGTVSAGVIAARGDNGRGIAGVTWQSTIMPLRALDSQGNGDPTRVEYAVRYAMENGARVINLSFAGGGYSPGLRDAILDAYHAGVLVVAAAGNAAEGGEPADLDVRPQYPVCLDRDSNENFIFGVASTDTKDRPANFSNRGASCVDASAPGVRVLGTQFYRADSPGFDKPYGGYYEGTSVSAPMVSGAAALLLALDRKLNAAQLTVLLSSNAAPLVGVDDRMIGKYGRGRIDVAAAVAKVLKRLKPPAEAPPALTVVPPGSDGVVVTSPGAGRPAEIRMFTTDGLFLRSFTAFPEGFNGGVSLATARFGGPVRTSIVTGALAGGAPQVRIFDYNTRVIGGFMAYDERFRGGVRVATGDLDGDGRDEIVTGAGPGGGPHVRIFAADGTVKGGFMSFDPARRGGVDVAVADTDDDGAAEIVAVAPGEPMARIYDLRGKLLRTIKPADAARFFAASGRGAVGSVKGAAPVVTYGAGRTAFSFYAYEPRFLGGVAVARLD